MNVSRRSLLTACLVVPANAALATQMNPGPWPSALMMATGRPGGVYDVYGPAWGRLAQQASGVEISYRASGGAAADILLIERGAAQLGMTTVAVANQARSGTGAWTAGVRLNSFRALFPIFPSILQIVVPASSGITALAGLSNLVVGVGPDGGTGATSVPAIFASLGVSPARAVTGDYRLQMRDMLAGKLAACAFIGAPPMPAIAAAALGERLALLGFTPAEAEQVARTVPGMTSMLIPAGMFPRQGTAIASVGTPNFSIGAASLPDSLASTVTLAAMRNRLSLESLVPAAALAPQPMLGDPGQMTFHPGAAMALRSLGLDLPARFVEG
jgi:TRAP transporter TAXI family solute receptor